ncbi:MAG: CHAP domain-containing protein [Oscillatoriales cyanobacterium]|nr:MAG: CHAP domain-containing protein [Oscillatoriales cyanobacterium]
MFNSRISRFGFFVLLRKYQQLSKQPQTNKESTMKLFTSSSKISLALFTAFAAASTVVTATFSNTKPAVAAQYCQCVHYANNRFQLRPPYVWSAKDYGSVLQRNGFRQVGPQPGAVVVMQSSFPGADRTHGHIGVVAVCSGNSTATMSTLPSLELLLTAAAMSRFGCDDINPKFRYLSKFLTPCLTSASSVSMDFGLWESINS